MADDEQFSLCWNNFNSNLSAGFHESLCRGDLVDVTLAAEGQFVKAHRLVLSVCSPYFRKMFTQMPANQHAFVFLKDVSHSALKDLIQFMYCGEVNVKQDALPAFISTAEALQIKGLTDGEPAPSQSPAKPSTPAPQPTIPAPSMTATSPRVRTQRSSTTRTYKLESEDSGDDKPQQIVLQSQTQQQQIVQQQQPQKRPAQRSITPHTVPSVKRVKNSDPLEATDPTQITVQTVADNKSTSGEAEFIDLPMDLPTKSEPDYAEDAGEVETAEQETTYVEDDSYGDMKYDESYFTENDETAGATAAATTSASATVKAQSATFSESYVSDTGDQSATEAQGKNNSDDIKVNYISSIKGGNQLCLDGYPFTRHRVRKDTIYWRCVQFRPLGCRARVRTNLDEETTQLNIVQRNHNHNILKERRKKGTLKAVYEERKKQQNKNPGLWRSIRTSAIVHSPPQYYYNRRGQLVYKDYTYASAVKNGPDLVVYWRCVSYKKTKCNASVKTKGKDIITAKGEHNHPPKPEKAFIARLWDGDN